MPFIVYVKRYQDDEPQAVSKPTTAGQALRLMGSLISGKNRIPDMQTCFAEGTRFGWYYSRNELAALVGKAGTRPVRAAESSQPPVPKAFINPSRGAAA